MLDSRLAASLLQDCPPARPRHCFKMIAARLLQGCCKNAAMFASRLVVRVLQGLPQDCCKSAPRLLQDLMQDLLVSFWNFPVVSGSLLLIKFNCCVLSVFFLLRFFTILGWNLRVHFRCILGTFSWVGEHARMTLSLESQLDFAGPRGSQNHIFSLPK